MWGRRLAAPASMLCTLHAACNTPLSHYCCTPRAVRSTDDKWIVSCGVVVWWSRRALCAAFTRAARPNGQPVLPLPPRCVCARVLARKVSYSVSSMPIDSAASFRREPHSFPSLLCNCLGVLPFAPTGGAGFWCAGVGATPSCAPRVPAAAASAPPCHQYDDLSSPAAEAAA